eukprot:3937439-Rhodomonas_salina.1
MRFCRLSQLAQQLLVFDFCCPPRRCFIAKPTRGDSLYDVCGLVVHTPSCRRVQGEVSTERLSCLVGFQLSCKAVGEDLCHYAVQPLYARNCDVCANASVVSSLFELFAGNAEAPRAGLLQKRKVGPRYFHPLCPCLLFFTHTLPSAVAVF